MTESKAAKKGHECVYSEYVGSEVRNGVEFDIVRCPMCGRRLSYQSLMHARPTEDT